MLKRIVLLASLILSTAVSANTFLGIDTTKKIDEDALETHKVDISLPFSSEDTALVYLDENQYPVSIFVSIYSYKLLDNQLNFELFKNALEAKYIIKHKEFNDDYEKVITNSQGWKIELITYKRKTSGTEYYYIDLLYTKLDFIDYAEKALINAL